MTYDVRDGVRPGGTEAADAAAPPDVRRRRRKPGVSPTPVVSGQVAAEEPVRGMDQAPTTALALIEPPVARIVEQLEQAAGVRRDPRVRDHEDHFPVALVLRQECAEVVVQQRPRAGVYDLLRPVRRLLPLVLPHVAGPPEVQICQRHLRRPFGGPALSRVPVSVAGGPRGGQVCLGRGEVLDDRLVHCLDRRAGGTRIRLLVGREQQRHAVVDLGEPQVCVAAQEPGLGEVIGLGLGVARLDPRSLREDQVRPRDHRIQRRPEPAGETGCRVVIEAVRPVSPGVGLAVLGAALIRGEHERGPWPLALQAAQRVVDGDGAAVQIRARLEERIGRGEALGLFDQQVGAGGQGQSDRERDSDG